MLADLLNLDQAKLLVVGDLMLDEYWQGDPNRISPEAPVPIILVANTYYRAGGAANVALNVAGLGSKVDLMGIIGKDPSGEKLQELLKINSKINNLIIVNNNNDPTITKLRIISNNQQLLRLDKEKKYHANDFQQLTSIFNQNIKNHYDAIILSDYNKGTLIDPQLFINSAIINKIPIMIDPKGYDCLKYKNATLLTPNIKEFKQMVDLNSINFEENQYYEQELREKGHNLIKQLNLQALVITQGKNGLTLLTNDFKDQSFPAYAREVFDVTGAGDTVIATIATCFANNKDLHKAAYLATIAAGMVVSRSGTYPISIDDLSQELIQCQKNLLEKNLELGIINEEKLTVIIKNRKLLGEKIVFVNGCFDVIHPGHIHYLEKAKSLGDRLVVAINDDQSIKILKGKSRPINNLQNRMQVLAAIKAVDWVIPFGFGEIRPGKLIEKLNPDILIKSKEMFSTIEEIPEYEGAAHVLKQGGNVYLLERPLVPEQNTSSSKIIAKINDITIDN